jgi:Tfp pilus assembly protein PilE
MRGFTLIETVIVIAFSSIMMLTIAVLAYNFNKISVYETTSAKSSDSASALMREIESLTFPADAVLQTHTFSGSTRTSSSTALVLEIPSIDSSGNAISNTYDYAAFYSVGTNAYRLLEKNALSTRAPGTKLLSSTVNALTFSYDSADFTTTSVVTADIQTQASVKQMILSDHLHEQIRLRNQ